MTNEKFDLTVPKMGESISEAHIGQIFKPNGSHVQQDDEILEFETDKVNIVLYAPATGKVNLTVSKDDAVKVDQVIGSIEVGAEASETHSNEEPLKESIKAEDKDLAAKDAPKTDSTLPSESIAESIRFSKEQFLKELKQPEPAISKQENKPVYERPLETPAVEEDASRKKLSRLRQTIAHRLLEAQSQTAMLTTFNEVDLSAVIALRDKFKEEFFKKHGVKLGFMSFFIKAVCSALKEFPELASYIENDEVVHKSQLDLSVAVSTDRGLVVPVIRQADALDFATIEKQVELYSKKAREGSLTIDEMRGGVFTITNGGVFGSLLSTPILNFPQSGILGMHKIEKRAVVIDDEIKIRSMMYIALTYDHRLIDGKEAVLFLVHVKNLLEDPSRFLLGLT